MTSINLEAFYDLPDNQRQELIAFHVNALKAIGKTDGFSGNIVFLDNGEGVYPRMIAAKYPRRREDLSAADRANRFLREIKMQASAYYHPNVHWPFKLVFTNGVPIAYFRRWEGDLSRFIESPAFGDLGRISLMIQLAAGLAHCHARGLVHQDLKPENVFVRDLQANFKDLPKTDFWLRPLIADFGSVNLAADLQEFRGSRPYMTPEQWQKLPLGEWTSVFALGVILHEIMSRGFHPMGPNAGDWHQQIRPKFNQWQKDKLWKRWLKSSCPVAQPLPDAEIAALVAVCLSPIPADRPKLHEMQLILCGILRHRCQEAASQVEFFLKVADEENNVTEWQHLTRQINQLEIDIKEHYHITK